MPLSCTCALNGQASGLHDVIVEPPPFTFIHQPGTSYLQISPNHIVPIDFWQMPNKGTSKARAKAAESHSAQQLLANGQHTAVLYG